MGPSGQCSVADREDERQLLSVRERTHLASALCTLYMCVLMIASVQKVCDWRGGMRNLFTTAGPVLEVPQ